MKIRNAVLTCALAVCIVSAVAFMCFRVQNGSSVVMLLDGEKICLIDSRSQAEEALSVLSALLNDAEIEQTELNITYGYGGFKAGENLSPEECACKIFAKITDGLQRAYAVNCSGTRIAVCSTFGQAESIVRTLSSDAENELRALLNDDSIVLVDSFEIKGIYTEKANITDYDKLTGGSAAASETGEETIEGAVYPYSTCNYVFDSVSDAGFARKTGGSGTTVFYGNTGLDAEYGTVFTKTYTEIIEYETVYTESRKLYVGETSVEKSGVNGLAETTVTVVIRPDGSADAQIVDRKIIREPENQLETVGIKPYPSTNPTGVFIWPIRYNGFYISSSFNVWRGSIDKYTGAHLGIDLACPQDTEIYAADGGLVVFAEKISSYGNLVKIQHEDGVMTYYAHLNGFAVKEGDLVYKGQLIGYVGMTGTATGFHLHFEVRIDGSPVNPILYLPERKNLEVAG